jgi:hypothetical protein
MERKIKTRHLVTTISVDTSNDICVTRLLHSHTNTYYHINNLYRYLDQNGISSQPGYVKRTSVASLAEILPKTAEIEREIDRYLGEYEGIRKGLFAELEALGGKSEEEIQQRLESAVEAERGKIFDIIARHRYGAAIEKFLEDNYK